MSSIMRRRSGLMHSSVRDSSGRAKVVDPSIFRQDDPSRYRPYISPSRHLARSALPRERFRCVPGMFSSLEGESPLLNLMEVKG